MANRVDLPLLFAIAKHRAWFVNLENHLHGLLKTAPLGYHQCHFGRWLETEGRARYGAQPIFQTIETRYRQVHGLATELLELHAHGRSLEALARLPEVYDLREALIGLLKALLNESQN